MSFYPLKATILCGISGSGKSGFANSDPYFDGSSNYIVSSRDLFRKLNFNHNESKNFWKQYVFSKDIEKNSKLDLIKDINRAVNSRLPIIIDNTNLVKSNNNILIKELEDLGFEVTLKLFNTSYDINYYLNRNNNRKDNLPESVINTQFVTALTSEYFLPQKTEHKNIIIVDLDVLTSSDASSIRSMMFPNSIKEINSLYLSGKDNISHIEFISSSGDNRYSEIKGLLSDLGFEMGYTHKLLLKPFKFKGDFKTFIYKELYSKYTVKKVFSVVPSNISFWDTLMFPETAESKVTVC